MKQICLDARMALHSGIGTYIRSLLPFIRQEFPSLQVLAPLSLVKKWPELGQLNLIPVNAPIYSIQEQLEIPWRVPACDLFWSPHYNIPLAPLRAKKRLVTIHDVYHLVHQGSLGWHKKCYANLMLRQATQRSDHIVTVSYFSRDEIVRTAQALPSKISVIPNGLNSSLFSFPMLSSKQVEVQSLYSLPEKYMIFVSTLAPHKNLARLLKAWKSVIEKHPDWHLVIVGKRTQYNDDLQVIRQCSSLSRCVHYLGTVAEEDLPALYEKAFALVYPSIYEGFGLPPIEAMSMGCPAIVSKAASLPEACGEAALYIDPYDEQDIAQKICTLIENPTLRQTLIEKGRKRIDRFSWEKAADSHVEIIKRMVV